MLRRARGSGAWPVAMRVAVAAALALAWLAPAWMASPAEVAAASKATGGVVAWGDNTYGQLNVPPEARSGVISVAAGCRHSLALRSDGRVIAWGANDVGQTNVPAAAQSGVAGIVAGCEHNLALKSNGTIVAWGSNDLGQSQVPSLPGGWKWTNIAAGTAHSVGVAHSRSAVDLYVWGDTTWGQQQFTPSDTDSTGWYDWYDIVDVEAGGNATIARMGDGSVRVWGDDTFQGVVAMGPVIVTPKRYQVPAGLADVVAISMGAEHALVARANGTVVAWGSNKAGQARVPRGLSKVKAVAGGGAHSLALKSDGTIVAWGDNTYGQATLPVRGKSRYSWIAAGDRHSLAVGQLTPAAPLTVVTTPWDGAMTVSWAAPDSGTAPITSYTVTVNPTGSTCTTSAALSCTIGGLENGTFYTFTVAATNSIGIGPAAVSLPVAPAVPAPPTPEPTAPPAPAPTPTQAPGPSGATGSTGGGLPAPVVVGLALVIGLVAAALAYKPSALVAAGRGLAGRFVRPAPTVPAGPPGPAADSIAESEPTDPPEFTPPQSGPTKR